MYEAWLLRSSTVSAFFRFSAWLCEEMRIEEKEINEIEEMRVNGLLYDFDTFYFASSSSQVYARRFSDVNGLQRLLEDVLSIAATEAICERFFRICSMITKRAYVTNLSERTVQRMSFIRYYKVEICNLVKKENMFNELRELITLIVYYKTEWTKNE